MTIPTIKTSRLILRALSEEDIDRFVHVLAEKDVLRYFPNSKPPSRSTVEKMVVEQLMHWQKYGYGWWAVEPRTERKFIGWCGLQYLRETDEIEVAYLLSRAYWGKGFATEAAQASLSYGFETLGLQCIVGIVHREHKASQRVLEKLGMSQVEEAHYFGMDCFRYVIERLTYKG